MVFLTAIGQESKMQEHKEIISQNAQKNESKPTNCEVSLLLLDNAITKAQKDQDVSLIVITRLGTEEKSKRLIDSRLKFVENYLTKARPIKHVLAEGKKAEGLGVIELYVQGKLESIIFLKKNAKNICPVPIG